jgi:hypothetical protein
MEPRHPYAPDGQPGLEVVHHPELEVAVQERLPYGQSLPEVRADEYLREGKEAATPVYSDYPEHYPLPASYPPHTPPIELAATEQASRKKRLWLVIGAVIALVVILAAVLGGVLGSRAAKSSGESGASQTGGSSGGSNQNPSSTGNTTDTSSNSTTQLQSIRQGSGLSVTGWRNPSGGVETYLFYQDPENGIRYSRCDTTRRTSSNNSACWESPVSIHSFADAGTRLASSTILWGDKYNPQTQLFYTGFKTRMLGLNLNPQLQPNISEDSVNRLEVFTGPSASLAAYWPWTVYQDSTGVLYHVRNLLGGNFEPSASSWDKNRINVTAVTSSRLTMVPTSTNFSLIAVKAGYAVFYQNIDSKLAVSITDLNHPQVPRGFTQPWPVDLPEIVLPKQAPLAAFSVARPNDQLQRVDSYVLYLNGEGGISVLYTALSSDSEIGVEYVEWKMAQPEVLKGVDRDTDIACLNMATSFWDAAEADVLLEGASPETARCFFQRGGRVVEVRLDTEKADWVVAGEVPMP